MQVYLGPRASGRTTALVKWLLAKPVGERGLIVMNTRERHRVIDLIHKELSKTDDWEYGNSSELLMEQYSRLVLRPGEVNISRSPAEWAVDNLEEILLNVLGVVPTIATGTNVHGLHIRDLRP